MEQYRINQRVLLLRKNGNNRMARIRILNADQNLVSIEWVERGIRKKKGFPVEALRKGNIREWKRYPLLKREKGEEINSPGLEGNTPDKGENSETSSN